MVYVVKCIHFLTLLKKEFYVPVVGHILREREKEMEKK
jgi:hypothetical protein